MTLSELLAYVDEHSGHRLLDGSPEETVQKARLGTHADPLAGEIVSLLAAAVGSDGLSRAGATTALGALRLRYMRDDAPVAGFRMVEHVVHAIDGAFNEEALRARSR
ncbi:MAG TPA: hypothetical protein VFN52_03815 [Acidiferrobacteraceae bacterium]|nr:hypothetical protein [Acidiferrobacteraceae bacterium]